MEQTPRPAPVPTSGARGPRHDGETDGGGGFWLGLLLAVLVGALVVGTVLVLDRPAPAPAVVDELSGATSWQEAALRCSEHADTGAQLVVTFGPHEADGAAWQCIEIP